MRYCICLLAALSVSSVAFPQAPNPARQSLYSQFLQPGNEARPRVWWHWMNGNITKEGIRKDLLWMQRAGIGGFQNFDASLFTPKLVDNRLSYMTPEWKDAFYYATTLADSLNLEMAIAGSPGWSETGGPWVAKEDGMKKIVWSELRVNGGQAAIQLPAPPSVTGPFQNMQKGPDLMGGSAEKQSGFYKDIAVLACPIPESDRSLSELGAVISSSGGTFSLDMLTDGDLASTVMLPSDTLTGYAWIQFNFPSPQTMQAVTVVGGGDKGPFGLYGELKDTRSLETSDDGLHFTRVCYIPAANVLQQTIAFAPVTARYFRVVIKNPEAFDMAALLGMGGGSKPKPPAGTAIAEVLLSSAARVHMFEEKAAFAPATELFDKTSPASASSIRINGIIDISSKLNSDGTLDWKVPPGKWRIIRFGYSLLGITNHPATPEATGLEVDKLDSIAIGKYFETYLGMYKDATRGLIGRKGLRFMVTDSWEAGAQNWTAEMPREFLKRRGYSLVPWLPVLAGYSVNSPEASDAFLFDYRKTLSEMLVQYHYDGLTRILSRYGMKRYSESHEDRRALIADGMEVKRNAAVPMSAMWMPKFPGDERTVYIADIRESASTAHIYGQNLVAAESFTASSGAYSYGPEQLKSTADLELANGLNRFIIHTSVHQPFDDREPGISLGPVGQWFTRHETWAEQAKAWTDYLARSSFLLQQGKFVADVLYYYGEDNNITGLFGKRLPVIPEGYNYDFINADALLHLVSVKNGRLVTPSGMSYRLLVLDSNARVMSIPVLKRIAALIRAGAVISGIRPESAPGLTDNKAEFSKLVDEIWNRSLKNVYEHRSIGEVLTTLKIQPDFTYTSPARDTRLLHVHRRLADGDLYWINNRSDRDERIEGTFRVAGLIPEIWHPETGSIEQASYVIAGNQTKVQINLSPEDALFIVFRRKAIKPELVLPSKQEQLMGVVDGTWSVAFQQGRGAPASTSFPKLQSLTENEDPGIRYFSGTVTYSKSIELASGSGLPGSSTWIDLGDVKNMAEVSVNGNLCGTVWKKPFRVDISRFIHEGKNDLQIRVTNLWVNRLIGDAQPNVKEKVSFTTWKYYQKESKLLPAGLIGPVKLIRIK